MKYFIHALDHTYTDESYTSTKFLGFCNTLNDLEKLKEEALKLPGFNKYPNSFVINKYIIDKERWENGFDNIVGEIGRDYLLKSDVIHEDFCCVKDLESVFNVSHSYTINKDLDDERFIGVFSNKEKAEKSVNKLRNQQGFKDYADDFDISEIKINDLLWKSGF